jgi:hypothetical protein
MKRQNFITHSLAILLFTLLFISCKKNKDVADPTTPTAKTGQVTCKIDGKLYTHNGSGYVLGNTHSFVKAENGAEQFSIDFFGMRDGDYTISGTDKTAGKAKLSYYPDAVSKTVYIAQSGSFKITKYQTTGGFKASGTFSGKFEKFTNNTVPTGIMIDVVDGSFTDIILFDVRP